MMPGSLAVSLQLLMNLQVCGANKACSPHKQFGNSKNRKFRNTETWRHGKQIPFVFPFLPGMMPQRLSCDACPGQARSHASRAASAMNIAASDRLIQRIAVALPKSQSRIFAANNP